MKLKREETMLGIFEGYVFALNQGISSYSEKAKVQKHIITNAGVVSYLVTKRCNYLILLDGDLSSSSSVHHIRTARKFDIPIVYRAFIDSCLANESLVAPTPFLFKFEDVAAKTLAASFNLGRISEISRYDDEFKSNISSKRQLRVWEFLDPAMLGFYDQPYTLAKYTVLMKESRINNELSFATVEIHVYTGTNCQHECIPKYSVFMNLSLPGNAHASHQMKFGVDGATISRTCRFTDDSCVALECYSKLIQTLTSPSRSMTVCDIVHLQIPPFVGSTEFQKVLEDLSVKDDRIHPEIKQLVGHMWSETLGIVGIGSELELIDLSIKKIEQAEKTLFEIAILKGQNSDFGNLVDKYFSFFPHLLKTDLSNKLCLATQAHYLQLLRDIKGITEATTNGIAGAYKALNCRINVVDKDSEEYSAVLNSIKDESEVNVLNIFAVRRPVEDDNFEFSLSNRQLLFHSSPFENFVGILSRGLLPPFALLDYSELDKTLRYLGNGIYFTDSFIKSAEKANLSAITNSRFTLIAEVALGKCYETSVPMTSLSSPPENYDSVHGLIGSFFKFNEFTVYNSNQQRLTYIIEYRLPDDKELVSKKELAIDLDKLWNDFKDKLNTDIVEIPKLISLEDMLAMKEKQLGSIKWGLQGASSNMIPLREVHIRSQIVDLAAKVVIIQEYFNNSRTLLKEFKYVFPLDDETSVCGFEAFVGTKHVVGEVQEKELAHKMYQEALAKGDGGYLMDEEAPEMFSIMIGNLPPMTKVVIKITYVTELATEGEQLIFRLPRGITREDVRLKESLEIGIEMPYVIRRISSPLNNIRIKKTETMATVQLDAGERLCNGFELVIDLAEIHVPRMWVENYEDNSSTACMLTFYPAFETESVDSDCNSVVIMLDASNSMNGELFETAKTIALLCIHKIPLNWNFNVVIFGSVWKELFSICQTKSLNNATLAKEFIESAQADMGCTDVALPLRALHLLPPTEGRFQNIFLISDGHIHNSNEILVKADQFKMRCFTFGIGSSKSPCGKHFLKKLSYTGGGYFEEFDVSLRSKWIRRVDFQLQRASQPVVTDVKVEWQLFDDDSSTPLQAPIKIPPIFHGNRQIVYGFVSHCNLATLKAKIQGVEMSTVVSTSESAKTNGKILHSLTARALIRDWNEGLQEEDCSMEKLLKVSKKADIVELSKKYSVLSPLTSFVAIELRNEEETMSNIEQLLSQLLSNETVDKLNYINFFDENLKQINKEALEHYPQNRILDMFSLEELRLHYYIKDTVSDENEVIRFSDCEESSVVDCEKDYNVFIIDNNDRLQLQSGIHNLNYTADRKRKSTVKYGRMKKVETEVPISTGNESFRLLCHSDSLPRAIEPQATYEKTINDNMLLRQVLDNVSLPTRSESPSALVAPGAGSWHQMLDPGTGLSPFLDRFLPIPADSVPVHTPSSVQQLGACNFGSDSSRSFFAMPINFSLPKPNIKHFLQDRTSLNEFSSRQKSSTGMGFGAPRSCKFVPRFPNLSSTSTNQTLQKSLFGSVDSQRNSTSLFCTNTQYPMQGLNLSGCGTRINSPYYRYSSDTNVPAPGSFRFNCPITLTQSSGTETTIEPTSSTSSSLFGALNTNQLFETNLAFDSRDNECAANQPFNFSLNPFVSDVSNEVKHQNIAKIPKLLQFNAKILPWVCTGPVPVSVTVKDYLISSNSKIFTDLVKSTLAEVCNSLGQNRSLANLLKVQYLLLHQLKSFENNDFPNLPTNDEWGKQRPDGSFDTCSDKEKLERILDDLGIKSLGESMRDITLRMCYTLRVLLHTLISEGAKLDLEINGEVFEIPVNYWADDYLTVLNNISISNAIKMLMALIYVIWVNYHHPCLFKTLQLTTNFSRSNWESFIYQNCFMRDT